MSKVIGIQFQQNGKMLYYDPNGIEAEAGQYVVADTDRGIDLGEVVMPPREMDDRVQIENMKKVVRLATPQDIQHATDNRVREREAYSVCQKKIAEHKLEMKLVSVEYAFDNSKILFFFTANGRVDFRSLVKDLASVFRMRIELRQIGVRDEAKMLGGLGPCGRPICCGTFLDQFQPVSIKMAKEQNLSLNPTKISGVCGRLMCCLKYEQDHYEQTRKKMPRVGKEAVTPDGIGQVTDLNIVKETVFVRMTNGDTSEIKEYPLEVISRPADRHAAPPVNARNSEKDPVPVPANDDNKIPAGTPAVLEELKPAPGRDSREPRAARDNGGRRREKRQERNPQERDRRENREDREERENQETAAPENKNRSKSRDQRLGQPVRRENPNRPRREDTRQNEKPDEKNRSSGGTENKPESESTARAAAGNEQKPVSSWAAALEDKMRAMNSGSEEN